MSAAPILTILRNGETVRSQSVEGEISIGRGDGNVIRLDDRAISRQHAVLRRVADGVQIEKRSDFGAIQLNGADFTSAVVRMGDIVAMGPYLLRIEQDKREPVAASPAPVLAATSGFDSARSPLQMDLGNAMLDPIETEESTEEAQAPSDSPTLALSPDSGSSSDLTTEAPTLAIPIAPESVTDSLDLLGMKSGSTDDQPTREHEIQTSDSFQSSGSSAPESASLDSIFQNIGSGTDFSDPDGPMEVRLDDDTQAVMNQSPDPVDEDAKTKLQSQTIEAKLVLVSGEATPAEVGIGKSEISIGRGKNCDIVLHDKKSSRKNTVIVRDGHRYILRDLDSANGSYVNEKSVKEKILSNGDRIRVGECEFRFVALNPNFEQQIDQVISAAGPFMPGSQEGPFQGGGYGSSMGSSVTQGIQYPPGGVPAAPEKKGLFKIYDRYIRNFSSLTPVQKLMVVLILFYLGVLFMEEDGEEIAETPVVQTAGSKRLANLTPDQRKYIETQYALAFDLYTKKDYDKSLFELKGIFRYLPEHTQGKELERYILEAKRIMDAKEEERKRKEEELRLKARIATLKTEIQEFMDEGEYEQAREKFAEILEIDPEDSQVGEWRTQIDAFFEEQERIAQEKRVQEEINRAAQETFKEAENLQKERRYHDSIKVYQRVGEMGSSDRSLLKKAKARIQACKDAIRDLREPVLHRARTLEQAGDLAGAFREYERATRVDPPHSDGYAGMDRIRDVLNQQSKALYTEAVIAESYSDFKMAYRKYKEILAVAPTGSVYHDRALRKIANYQHFRPEEEEPQQ